jgi:hypothetical protein
MHTETEENKISIAYSASEIHPISSPPILLCRSRCFLRSCGNPSVARPSDDNTRVESVRRGADEVVVVVTKAVDLMRAGAEVS